MLAIHAEAKSNTMDKNQFEKATIAKTPTCSHNGVRNYSDKNGNKISKNVDGRRTFAFWTLVCLLFILAIGNLLLTFTILAVLRLGQGMESMEYLPDENSIKFFGYTDLDSIYKKDGLIEGFSDQPLSVESEGGSVSVNLQMRLSRSEPKIVVNQTGVFFRGTNAFEVVDPDNEDVIFSTSNPEIHLPNGVNNMQAKVLSTKRIASPLDQDLLIRSETSTYLRGAEGTKMESKKISLTADQDINIQSLNGSIVLSAKTGIYVDVKYLPIVSSGATVGQFKLCVCMPQGKIFRVPLIGGKVSCERVHVGGVNDPCN